MSHEVQPPSSELLAARVPMQPPWWKRAPLRAYEVAAWIASRLASHLARAQPRFLTALLPMLGLTLILYTRHPRTNYIFDEQEALLANPYVNGLEELSYGDAFVRDFWGLPPHGSIGSYRPLPNLLWRALWQLTEHPFFHSLINLVFHALNGAILASFVFAVTGRRRLAWYAGFVFVAAAVITEAVSGIVGIADVMGGLGALLALAALRLPAWGMPAAVFGAMLIGLFSKESALVCVPLVPLAALVTAPHLHPQRPARVARALLSFAAALAAFVLYVELRKDWFPSPLPSELSEALPDGAPWIRRVFRELLVWFHQAPLPRDPLNNPLADADVPHRVAGALRVYWRGLVQIVFPWPLSGDYSYPQEPVPKTLWGWETIAGAAMMVLPILGALALLVAGWLREAADRRRLVPAGELSRALADVFGPGRSERVEAPLVALEARASHRGMRQWALILGVAGASALATEIGLLRQGEPAWVRTWPVAAFVLVLAAGLALESTRAVSRPMRAAGPWPLGHVAPPLLALAAVWLVVSYFPHSNIPVVLPTVRAERFWYFPVIGSSIALALAFEWLAERLRRPVAGRLSALSWGRALFFGFFAFQCVRAYAHAMDYENDLVFWEATKNAVPRSAKAHLNFSVMKGARGDLETRLVESRIAAELAPEWAMAHVYTGDTLCRMHRADEAWPHYVEGFRMGPNERGLLALAMQCLWDEDRFKTHETELRKLADDNPGSWLAYLAIDTLQSGETHGGVDPQYRPRGYNEKAKEK